MGKEKEDPTKDLGFQKVLRHFVTTPHKPHAPLGQQKKLIAGNKANPYKKRCLALKQVKEDAR
ncbi:MAG: hypothetical protein ACRDRL_29730 [Sciscionella sp.]